MTHNRSLGQAAGVAEEDLDALEGPVDDNPRFTDREIAALRWTIAVVHNTARREQATFDALPEYFSEDEIVELTVLAAHRTMITRIQEALCTDLEDSDFPANDRPRVAADGDEWVRWYAQRVQRAGE